MTAKRFDPPHGTRVLTPDMLEHRDLRRRVMLVIAARWEATREAATHAAGPPVPSASGSDSQRGGGDSPAA